MMKKFFCLLFLAPFLAVAQKVVTHKVGPKESLSSIGRMYNINGRELANYNKIDYDKGLAIGQVLKIPVKSDADIPKTPAVKETVTAPVKEKPVKETAPAKNITPADTKGTPIYHTVAKKETLYHISTLYGKVPVADIKKWNNLTGDGVTEGTKLIVGYSKTKADDKLVKAPVKKPEEKVEEVSAKPAEEKTVAVKESVKKEEDDVKEKKENISDGKQPRRNPHRKARDKK